MATTENLKNQLAEKKENAVTQKTKKPETVIADYLKKMGPEIEKALPSHMNPDRMARIALTTIRTNPKLLECSVPSLLGAVMQAAQLGLEPGLLGHCYLVPFKNNKLNAMDVQFIIGYKGMIDLARRSGQIQNIYAHCVYVNDEFEYELGLEPKLKHKPAEGDRGALKGVYGVAHFKDGGYQFEYMPKAEIERRKQRSKSYGNGPWVTDYEEMAKKTVIRYMFKYLPISVEIINQAQNDEVVRRDISEEPVHLDENIFDVPATEVSAEEQ